MNHQDTQVAIGLANAIAPAWQWRDRFGNFHDPETMRTSHLFYTLRMIWNHTMPPSARSATYQAYNFGPFYTEAYLKRAIVTLTPILARREDLTPGLRTELERMIAWLATHQLSTAQPKELI